MSKRPILIVGGGGVFGSRLARGLCRDGVRDLVLAGRRPEALRGLADELGCEVVGFDRSAPDVASRLAAIAPFAVVDAAGPFQGYGDDPYRFARAVIAVGAHYLDLSDDGVFTKGIPGLEAEAARAGVAVLSGVSSVPAISGAAVAELSQGMEKIDLIDTVILPGNRAPRGLSVVRAILAQVGRPLGGDSNDLGWIGTERRAIETGAGRITRLASPIGAPDLHVMKDAFGAEEVRFRAGLELPLLHRGLAALAHLVKWGLVKRPELLARPLRWVAALFEPFGSDRGAMEVRVLGASDGASVDRRWVLLAEAGDGPHVPAIPARVLVQKLLRGEVEPGARVALRELALSEIEGAAPERAISFQRS